MAKPVLRIIPRVEYTLDEDLHTAEKRHYLDVGDVIAGYTFHLTASEQVATVCALRKLRDAGDKPDRGEELVALYSALSRLPHVQNYFAAALGHYPTILIGPEPTEEAVMPAA